MLPPSEQKKKKIWQHAGNELSRANLPKLNIHACWDFCSSSSIWHSPITKIMQSYYRETFAWKKQKRGKLNKSKVRNEESNWVKKQGHILLQWREFPRTQYENHQKFWWFLGDLLERWQTWTIWTPSWIKGRLIKLCRHFFFHKEENSFLILNH